MRVELGLQDSLAAEVFAMVIFLSDDHLVVRGNTATMTTTSGSPCEERGKRFFRIIVRLPIELQMLLCHRVFGSTKNNILTRNSEPAFRSLAKAFS
jgi:hypothetical protein